MTIQKKEQCFLKIESGLFQLRVVTFGDTLFSASNSSILQVSCQGLSFNNVAEIRLNL